MRITVHKSGSRGLTSTGWLVSRHSFSFNNWYDPTRIQFGALRVLNDDLILPGAGFPPHSHRDMEIVTIPLRGTVAHKDSSGGEGVVSVGEVQIMSAGTGVTHSEYNASNSEPLELLQIWILPEHLGLKPRYKQKKFAEPVPGSWRTLVSPNGEADSLQIFQNSWFSIIDLETGGSASYTAHTSCSGVYVFLIFGSVTVAGAELLKRDGVGITEALGVQVATHEQSRILVVEVPLK